MKLRVSRDELGGAVAFVSRALSSRPVIPVLSGMLLDAGPGTLTLSCFDYEVSARITIEADVAEPGSALVPGRLLAEITRSLPAHAAELATAEDVVSLTCGPSEFGLVGLPVQDYPAVPEVPEPVGTASGGTLALAVTQVAPAASRDDTLPMLTAVCLDITGSVMTLAATDRYRLAAREVRFQPAAPGLRGIALVPARFMTETARAMSGRNRVSIGFNANGERPAEGLISFTSGGRRLTARLLAGEFVKYRSRFPDSFSCRAEMAAEPLIDAVRRAALVAERAGPVRLSFGNGQLVIEAHAEGRARASETLAADFAGDQPVISFNPYFLLDGLTAAAASVVTAPTGHAAATEQPGDGSARPAAVPESADSHGAQDPARLRLEFSTAAKPALITSAVDTGLDAAEPEPGKAEPNDGEPVGAELSGTGSADVDSGVPAFRYLLVPLRVPVRS